MAVESYDVIVVGAGSSGAVIASRLSEDPGRSVLLLEAGPDYPTLDALPDDLKWGHRVPAAGRHDWDVQGRMSERSAPALIRRGKVTGGSSAVNAQIFLRGLPEDFEAWAAAGAGEWSFAKVLPCFRAIETDVDFSDDVHGGEGPVTVRRYTPAEWRPDQWAFFIACRRAGFPDDPDLNRPSSTGVGALPLNSLDGVRLSTALCYLSRARGRANLTLRPECLVRRIVWEGRRAAGVEVERRGTTSTAYGRQIVVSAGAIGSPQLLMLSGVGPAGELKSLGVRAVVADLPGVGKNLRDHPTAPMTWRLKRGVPVDPLMHAHQVGLRYTAADSRARNDMIVYPGARAAERIVFMRPSLALEAGAGELRLASADPHAPPALDFRCFRDPLDRHRMRQAIRLCLELAEDAAFKDILEERIQPTDADLASDAALDDWMLRAAATGHHVSCTCKLGPASDPLAVVDQYGHVHGVEGLRVADASIMPDCVRANINATVIMIGERVADFVRRGR